MTSINAFVGHSFTEEDDALVAAILTYLAQVASLHPGFTWVHAKHPEPISVNEKVLALLEGKDLFIGICTRKELVVEWSALSSSWWKRDALFAKESDFEWKTSDWIIQEIGLAIGRGMKIILLIEDGIRRPGALQGNLEHIPLSRSTPEKSFGTLLGMLTALLPHSGVGQAAGQQTMPASSSSASSKGGTAEHDWITPKPDWKKGDFEFGMMQCIATNNESAKRDVDEKFLASDVGASQQRRDEWAAYKEYMCILFGRGGNIAKLEGIASGLPDSDDAVEYLARAYEHYEEYQKAAPALRNAAEKAKLTGDKVRLLGQAAVNYEKAGQSAEADAAMTELHAISARTGDCNVEVLVAEKNLGEQRKDDDAEIATQERLLELNPSDVEIRFSLAYKYSLVNRDGLAAYHYSRIQRKVRSPMVWNNLGVAFQSLKLPIKAVDAYVKSIDLGETLAMANLANRFLKAGFLREAEEMLATASKIEGHHKNVDHGFGTLRDDQDAEEKNEAAIFEKAKQVSAFYRRYGCSIAGTLSGSIAGAWRTPSCNVTLRIDGDAIVAQGSYQVSASGLISAMMGAKGMAATPARYSLEYRGVLRGCTISGVIVRKQEGEKSLASTLLGVDTNPTFLIWIDDSLAVLHVMERPQSGEPTYYEFQRV